MRSPHRVVQRSFVSFASLLSVPLLLAGCGSGAALFGGGSGSGGGTTGATPPPPVVEIVVEETEVSPARLSIRLRDDDSRPFDLELFLRGAGGVLQTLNLVGVTELDDLESSPVGFLHVREWDFATQLGSGGFAPDQELLIRVVGGPELLVTGIAVGNDAPVVSELSAAAAEIEGPVELTFGVSDSSSGSVQVAFEYDELADQPDAGWRTASVSPPGPFDALPEGSVHLVSWDAPSDLPQRELDVRVRARVEDGFASAPDFLSPVFRVDNNRAPTASFDSTGFETSPDTRRGVPLFVNATDPEGDATDFLVQWRFEGEAFPPLPDQRDEILALLADPLERARAQVFAELPPVATGRAFPVSPQRLQLPELFGRESWLVAGGLEGRALELLRPDRRPQAIGAAWPAGVLSGPVGVLPGDAGTSAFVLDRGSAGGWRLRELDLETGSTLRFLAENASGEPGALARAGESLFVLERSDPLWRLLSVSLQSAQLTELYRQGAGGAGPARDLLPVGAGGAGAAWVTAGDALLQVRFPAALPASAHPVLDGLNEPWGLAPAPSGGLWIAERSAPAPGGTAPGRLVQFDPAIGSLVAGPFVQRPTRILAEGQGLWVLGDRNPSDGTLELQRVLEGAVAPFASGLPILGGSFSLGPRGLFLLALDLADDLALGGGSSASRRICSVDPATRTVELEEPLDPLPAPGTPWLLEQSLRAGGSGAARRFVLDASGLSSGERRVRVLAFDGETGAAVESAAPRTFLDALDVQACVLGEGLGGEAPAAAVAADLDGDGRLDVVQADPARGELALWFQNRSGTYAVPPNQILIASFADPTEPFALEVLDAEGDGAPELFALDRSRATIDRFERQGDGTYAYAFSLGGPGVLDDPRALTQADFDGDGSLELAVLLGNGTGVARFTDLSSGALPSFSAPPTPVALEAAAVGDFNADGFPDLVALDGQGGSLHVFAGGPTGFGAAPASSLATAAAFGATALAGGDLDGDGRADLALAGPAGLVMLLQGEAGLDGTPVAGLSLGGEDAGTVALLRSAASPYPDLVATRPAAGDAWLFRARGPLEYGPPSTLGEEALVEPRAVTVVDLDGDGAEDLLIADPGAGRLARFHPSRAGTLPAQPLPLTGVAGPVALATADFDLDGQRDLVAASFSGEALEVFLQTESAQFGAPTSLGLAGETTFPSAVVATDLDGDGRPDLAAAHALADRVSLYRQSESGFGSTPDALWDGPPSTQSLASADFDVDGQADLVAGGRALWVFLQEEPGRFPTVPDQTLGGLGETDLARAMVSADLDGDGRPDLVSANELGNDLALFLNTEAGFPTSPDQVLGGRGLTDAPYGLVAVDLDLDGALDLVSVNRDGGDLTLFLQEGAGVFPTSPSAHVGVLDEPVGLAVVDLNQDGAPDLVCADAESGMLSVFLQRTPGTYPTTADRLVRGLAKPTAVLGVDLDLDGDPDLVAAERTADRLALIFAAHQ